MVLMLIGKGGQLRRLKHGIQKFSSICWSLLSCLNNFVFLLGLQFSMIGSTLRASANSVAVGAWKARGLEFFSRLQGFCQFRLLNHFIEDIIDLG